MDATTTKIEKKPSTFGGYFTSIHVKDDNGETYNVTPDEKHGTIRLWKPTIEAGVGARLFGLRVGAEINGKKYLDYHWPPTRIETPVDNQMTLNI